jgi:hypothetical protein
MTITKTPASAGEILSRSRERTLARVLAKEIETGTAEQHDGLAEMRRFLAVKGYRELLPRLEAARQGKHAETALIAVAQAMRRYALEQPALSAAANCPECRNAHEHLHGLMRDVLAECRLTGDAAENAVHMLRSLVRGYVRHEVMQTLQGVDCYDAAFHKAVQVFVAGLPAFASQAARATPHKDAAFERQPLGG